jgi:hypothetical protein
MPVTKAKSKPAQLAAARFIHDAEEYVESARQLVSVKGGTRKWPSPIYFLLSHAMELALKAYLAASGVSIGTLRRRIGHDLKLALRRAQQHGYVPTDAFTELVQWLAPYHLDHFFRYGKGSGWHQFPVASETAEIIADAVKAIERHVRENIRHQLK